MRRCHHNGGLNECMMTSMFSCEEQCSGNRRKVELREESACQGPGRLEEWSHEDQESDRGALQDTKPNPV